MRVAATRRAPRRSTEEVRALILDAAARQFAARGYAETTTRSIAAEAKISGSVLHRSFPTKEQLFAGALVRPFVAFFDEIAAVWSQQVESPWDDERLLREFVSDFYRNVTAHRHTLATLLAVGGDFEGQLRVEVRQGLATGLEKLRVISEQEAEARGFSPDVIRYTNPLVMSLITGIVLMQPWLDDLGEDDDALIDLVVRLVLYGIRLEPPPGG